MTGTVLIILAIHAAAAVGMVRLAPRLRVGDAGSATPRDVMRLAMVALLVPVAVAAARTGGRLEPGDLPVLSWPAVVGLLGLGLALLVDQRAGRTAPLATGDSTLHGRHGDEHGQAWRDGRHHGEMPGAMISLCALTGIILLLVSMLGTLSVAVGQSMFAAAMVIFWLGLPHRPARRGTGAARPSATEHAIPPAFWLLVAVQALCFGVLPREWLSAASAALIVPAAAVMIVGTIRFSRATVIDAALWTAATGVLLVVGMHSFARVLGATLGLVVRDERAGLMGLVHGIAIEYWRLAPEAVVLAGIPMLVIAGWYAGRWWQRAGGAVYILIAAALFGWRVAQGSLS